jgi:hypothetical protein
MLDKDDNMDLETVDDSYMKIFNKLNYTEEKMHRDDIVLDSETSNTKIFIQVRSLSGNIQ